MVFVEIEAPRRTRPAWPPPPLLAAMATAKPPETARTLVPSLAVSDTPPPLATTELVPPQFVIEAAIRVVDGVRGTRARPGQRERDVLSLCA